MAFAAMGAMALSSGGAHADAGGVGFWLPGSMGSLSAVPGTPGWSITSLYLHLEANAGAGKELQNNASIVTGLHARADAIGFLPAYDRSVVISAIAAQTLSLAAPPHNRAAVDRRAAASLDTACLGGMGDLARRHCRGL